MTDKPDYWKPPALVEDSFTKRWGRGDTDFSGRYLHKRDGALEDTILWGKLLHQARLPSTEPELRAFIWSTLLIFMQRHTLSPSGPSRSKQGIIIPAGKTPPAAASIINHVNAVSHRSIPAYHIYIVPARYKDSFIRRWWKPTRRWWGSSRWLTKIFQWYQ